jgi:diguanylate cyclase (GGDEF)-like protein
MDRFELTPVHTGFIAEQVRGDRLQQLFLQSRWAVLGSYLAATMLCWMGRDLFERDSVWLWLALLTASTLLRTAMFIAFYRTPLAKRTPQPWERRYWITLMFSAAIWGFGALGVMPSNDLLGQLLVVLFAVGMSVSAVSCYSSHRYMTLASVAVVLLPSTLWMLCQPSSLNVGVALAVLVFASFVINATTRLSEALEQAFHLRREMEWAHKQSAHAAQIDELTGLNNRRAFFVRGQRVYDHCRRQQLPLCAVMLDMDHFKVINDTYGHQQGDQVLQQLGIAIGATFREGDVCGRLGGEEFAVLLPDTPLDVGMALAAQLLARLSELHATQACVITASLGVAISECDDQSLQSLMNRADKALYCAKAQGRNRVCVAEPAAA